MASKYFQNFPLVTYNGKQIKNITLRVQMCSCVQKFRSSFYPYVVQDGERADMIAHDYYGDSNYVWLVYFANEIIDPYHQWYLSYHDFLNYIEDKYGSVAAAQSEILYYKNSDGDLMTPESYNLASVFGDSATVTTGFSAYYAYDFEVDQNDKKRFINLLDNRYTQQAEREIESLLNNAN